MDNTQETSADIIAEMRNLGKLDEKSIDKIPRTLMGLGLRTYADRFEAAHKREADSIHRAMVLIAGIEMENSEDPPKLWTALEDAYDALCDALGTDGDTTADVEEAKATGRYFVVKPSGNAAAMREALEKIAHYTDNRDVMDDPYCADGYNLASIAKAALAEPPRNCDRFDDLNSAQRNYIEHGCQKGLGMIVDGEIRKTPWKSQFEKWLFDKEKGESK